MSFWNFFFQKKKSEFILTSNNKLAMTIDELQIHNKCEEFTRN